MHGVTSPYFKSLKASLKAPTRGKMHANPLIEFMEGFFVMLTTAFVQRNMLSGLNPHIAPDLVPRVCV